jgi:hypothetical protein
VRLLRRHRGAGHLTHTILAPLAHGPECPQCTAKLCEHTIKALNQSRGRAILEIMAIWDATAKMFPELAQEHKIAIEWLTHTFTIAEIEGVETT